MSIPLTINGAVFEYPVDFDENWGVDATGWAQAVTNGMLQMAGGSFPITADINFGPNFGLLSKYFETRSSNPATIGTVRLSSADAGIAWRNFANSGNNILTTDASNNLQYNGSTISGGVNPGTQYKLAYYATTSSNVSPNPNTTAATQVLVTDANGVPTTAGNGGTTATEIGYVSGVTSAIQTQIDLKAPKANPVFTGQITAPVGSAGAPSYSFTAHTNTGMYEISDTLGLVANGVVGIQVTATQGQAILGTTTNNNATAGNVGEYVTSTFGPINLPASSVIGDATSIVLTAGDWDINVVGEYNIGTATGYTRSFLAVTTTPGNSGTGFVSGDTIALLNIPPTSVDPITVTLPGVRASIAATTTYYFKMQATYSTGQPTLYGRISARRVR